MPRRAQVRGTEILDLRYKGRSHSVAQVPPACLESDQKSRPTKLAQEPPAIQKDMVPECPHKPNNKRKEALSDNGCILVDHVSQEQPTTQSKDDIDDILEPIRVKILEDVLKA